MLQTSLPYPVNFFEKSPIKTNVLHGAHLPHLNEASQMKNTLLLELKGEASFHEMIPRKNPKKLETDIVSCVSLIKQHWKKVVEITKK